MMTHFLIIQKQRQKPIKLRISCSEVFLQRLVGLMVNTVKHLHLMTQMIISYFVLEVQHIILVTHFLKSH